jgi:hypothetical protein
MSSFEKQFKKLTVKIPFKVACHLMFGVLVLAAGIVQPSATLTESVFPNTFFN